jgi:hypothetical protein
MLISWCVGDMCDMVGSEEDLGRSRRPGAEDRRWSSTGWVLSMDGRSGGRVTPCAVRTVHKQTRSVGFLFESQN